MVNGVLIVDDSRTIRAVLRQVMGLAGISMGAIHDAANGEEALKILRSARVDLVMTDVHMPVMGGVELVGHIRKDGRLAGVPIVVISSDSTQQRRAQLRELGVQSILSKPFMAEDIRDILSDMTGDNE